MKIILKPKAMRQRIERNGGRDGRKGRKNDRNEGMNKRTKTVKNERRQERMNKQTNAQKQYIMSNTKEKKLKQIRNIHIKIYMI